MNFLDWFLKTLLSPVAKDVASKRPQTKEEAILKAQQFEFIYTQSGYLYTIIPDAPRARSSWWDTPGESHATDGFIGSITQHLHLYTVSPLMSPHFINSPNVSQPKYTPEFSHALSYSISTPSYVSPTPIPHIHRPNFLAPTCNG